MKIVIQWEDFVNMARTELQRTQPLATGAVAFVITSNTQADRCIAETPDEVHITLDTPYL